MQALELLYLFRSTIDDEKRAQARYEEAARCSEQRPDLQRVFLDILREEKDHERRLVELYNASKEGLLRESAGASEIDPQK